MSKVNRYSFSTHNNISSKLSVQFDIMMSEVKAVWFYPTIKIIQAKSIDHKERQVDRKSHKVFVTAHAVLHMATMFLAIALNRESHPPEILKMATNTGGDTSV